MKVILKNYYMPMPSNLYYWWNFGSLLGMCLLIQIVSGLFLSMFYENSMEMTFHSINQIERNVNMGWAIRSIHANGASLFFILAYLHIGRGLFFKSFYLNKVWLSGVMILLLLFATAFLGYVLPWGQMSLWGATVITNLVTSIPYVGNSLTYWIWGNFSINKATLMRFFSFHFILPFLILTMVLIHIIFLHNQGSSNPLGSPSNMDKIPFQPYFSYKDLLGVLVCVSLFTTICLIFPNLFMDPDNFTPANPLVTPPHIQPEWYFLFAYAILRTIPNKLGGVAALLCSIFILAFLPLVSLMEMKKSMDNKIIFKMLFFFWVINFIYLSILGAMPIEDPFTHLSSISSVLYFSFFICYL